MRLLEIKWPFFHRVAVHDEEDAPLLEHLPSCCQLIERVRLNGGCTLVHCNAGVSRSVSVCLAYLISCQHMSLRDAYARVKARRPMARPNVGFFKQLIEFEKEIFDGHASVEMVTSPVGIIPDVYLENTANMVWLSPP